MQPRWILILLLLWGGRVAAQAKPAAPVADSLAYYADLFRELENFLDSMVRPSSFGVVSAGFGNGFFSYAPPGGTDVLSRRHNVLTPSAAYFHKSGFGLSATASVLEEKGRLQWYQAAATASFDYLKGKKGLAGLSYTKLFTGKDLPFYTSPLSNEAYAYFSYRQWWLRPSLAATYGWGSQTGYEERKSIIKLLKKKKVENTTVEETRERVSDLSLTATVKHDFYWRQVMGKKDLFRLTPQLAFTGGTQRYGLSQTTTTYVSGKKPRGSVGFNTENFSLNNASGFRPLSVAVLIKTEYAFRQFFIQPQLVLDYYFPADAQKLTTTFGVNGGIIF